MNGYDDIPDWKPGNGEDEYEFDPHVAPAPEEGGALPPGVGVEILLIAGPPHLSGKRITVEKLSDNEVLIDGGTGEMWSYQQDRAGSTHYFFDPQCSAALNKSRQAVFKRLSFRPREIRDGAE